MFVSSKDLYQILTKLTPKRIINLLKLYGSFQYSKRIKKAKIYGFPASVSIEPTTACNLRCPECPSGLRQFDRPTGNLQNETFFRLINEVHSHIFYLLFYFQGEPFLNPHIFSWIRYAHNLRIYTATSTNAHFLDTKNAKKTVASGLDRLIISIDGTTQETYESYRKSGQLKKVLEGTQNIIAARKELKKKTPAVIWQFLVVRPNEHQIDEIKKLGKEMQVDKVVLKTAQIYNYQNGNPLIPTQSQYSRYKKLKNGQYILKNKFKNECWKMWHSCVMTWDGRIVPCCFDKQAHHAMGMLNKDSFETIWHSSFYQKFRQTIVTHRKKIEICKNCTEGTRIWS